MGNKLGPTQKGLKSTLGTSYTHLGPLRVHDAAPEVLLASKLRRDMPWLLPWAAKAEAALHAAVRHKGGRASTQNTPSLLEKRV